ncbi:MAG: hypothetical protein D6722_25550 [Bacteroidetes bacterium]|nr:MAG: hypothetical protein D6722_25550 [Bacteroidota bacterium]
MEPWMIALAGWARLMFAYLLARRLLRRWRDRRLRGAWLYALPEAIVIAGLSYLAWGQWSFWGAPLWVAGGYLLSALGAQFLMRRQVSRSLITAEALVQSLGLTLLWALYQSEGAALWEGLEAFWSRPAIGWIALGYAVVWWPAGFFIQWLTAPWQAEVQVQSRGLPRAGRWIGMLERTLVLTFVLLDALSAIGFLITAKSILRFGEISDPANRKGAEYILIGTLVSFLWAILTGLLVRGPLLL